MAEDTTDFLQVDEAKQFMNARTDVIEREILWMAYAKLLFRMAPNGPAAPFDVLFFMRLLSELMKDRAELIEVLSGNLSE